MLCNKIIRPSESPWNAPIIIVKKKDGSNRFVCDYRNLNSATKRDTYPLPNVKDVTDKMHGSNYWTTLDAASAYWPIQVRERDKEKTAFSVQRGKFEFNVTPYGLCNAGASYQRLIDITLAGLAVNRVLAYMDDIIIFTTTFKEHIDSLREVFRKLKEAGIQLKGSKCVLGSSKVEFLGFELSNGGIKPQSRLTDAIKTFATPTNRKEVRRFLGLAGFYRAFINNFASITRPLSRLTSENVAFLWAEECELAFKYLKISLMTRPVLVFPKFDKDFIVEVDASEMAIGGVLSQYQEDGKIHPVAYFSKALNPNQIKWSVYNKEAYAMVSAVQHWYVYLYGNKFILNSDNNPLTFLQHKKDPKGKIGRWIAELEGFDFKVEYIPGRNNVKADALSRNRNASEKDSYSDILEDNIYVVSTENTSFTEQLRQEQESDIIISNAKKLVLDGMPVNEGQLKRITKQLRIERGKVNLDALLYPRPWNVMLSTNSIK